MNVILSQTSYCLMITYAVIKNNLPKFSGFFFNLYLKNRCYQLHFFYLCIFCCFSSKILYSGFTTALKVHRKTFRKQTPNPLEMMEATPLTVKWKVCDACLILLLLRMLL